MTPQFKLAAITDEFSPDLATALDAMVPIGMTGAELRVVFGKNIMDLDGDELKRAKDLLDARGMTVMSIASPLLKCVLDGGPAADTRFQQDIFNSKHTFADQPRLADHAFMLAKYFGAPIHWCPFCRLQFYDLRKRVVEGTGLQPVSTAKSDG